MTGGFRNSTGNIILHGVKNGDYLGSLAVYPATASTSHNGHPGQFPKSRKCN